MVNKKRIIVFVVFVLFMFIFITFAGGTPQNQAIATRNVTFIDSFNNVTISEQRVIVGEDAEVPSDPSHDALVFAGWYLEEDRDQRVTDFSNITKNLTVVALYAADRNRNGIADDNDTYYIVSFIDTFDNSEISSQRVLIGMDATAPDVPTHAGMTFAGWSRAYTNVRGNITVNTVWNNNTTNVEPQVNRYRVTFVDGDTNLVIKVEEVNEGLTASVPTAPKHNDRVFLKWEGNYSNVTSNETVTAIYTDDVNNNGIADDIEDKYVVNYYAGLDGVSGIAPKDETSYLTGQKYVVLENTFVKDNAIFIGWSTTNPGKLISTEEEENGLSLVQAKSSFTIGDTNVAYYAVWAIDANNNGIRDYKDDKFTVTYVAGENGTLEGTAKYENVLTGYTFSQAKITVPTPKANEGYAFDKWTPVLPVEDTAITADLTYTAVFAEDKNGNNVPDYRDDKFTVTYVAGENGTLEGTAKYENVLTRYTFSQAKITVPTPKANEGYAFDKWTPVLPKEDTAITADLTYTAVFAEDKNGNNVPDYRDDKFTVEFKAGSNGKLEGTAKYENVLTGYTFSQAGITVPTPKADTNYIFKAWTPVIAETVTGPATYTATFAPDFNGNGKDDTTEDHFDVKFIAGNNGKLEGTTEFKDILVGLKFNDTVTVPIPKANEGYAFDKWTPVLPVEDTAITADLTYTAVFAEDKNGNNVPDYRDDKFTVEFIAGSNGKLEGTTKYENVVTGYTFSQAGITVPTPKADTNYMFKAWTPVISETVTGPATYTATFAPDFNGNGKDDNDEAHFDINFVAGANGKLEGKTSYEDVLIGLTFEKAGIIVPTPKADTNYVFNGWTPAIDKDVIKNVTYVAKFALDENGNKIPDADEDKYTIRYDKNIATNGVVPQDDIQYVTGKKYTVLGNAGNLSLEDAVFVGWSTEAKELLTEEDETVITPGTSGTMGEQNIVLYAVFAEDKNGNNKPDYKDQVFTVIFKDEDGTELKSEDVLSGMNATAPSNPTKESTAEYTYTFAGWDKEFTEVQENLIVNATYSQTKNTYTVTFVNYNDEELDKQTVEYGTAATAPEVPARENYTFTGWNKEFNNVVADMTVKAQFEANLIGIEAKEKSNVQLQFQVESNPNIKEYIEVYKVYADGSKVLASNDEYTTDFTAKTVVKDKTLTITLNEYTDTSLDYDITEKPAYPTKFEIIYNPTKSYKKTKNQSCTDNCDSNENTRNIDTEYTFLEVVEHYDENIKVQRVEVIYKNGETEKLNVSDSVRWTHKDGSAKCNPVYIATTPRKQTIKENIFGYEYDREVTADIMNDEYVIDTVKVTYNRTGYGTYTVEFKYNANTDVFKAVDEKENK